MKRAKPGAPPPLRQGYAGPKAPRGARHRHDKMPRVMIICQDEIVGNTLRSEMRRLLREPWFVAYESIYDYHDSIDCNLIHDIIIYCPDSREKPEEIKDAIGKIMFYCREAKIVLYTGGRGYLDDHRIAETVIKPDIDGLAVAVNKLLRPEAA